MRIVEDVKLDFDDVLIRPKRSTLTSRKDVDLYRSYKFKHSGMQYRGIPIMAANMDTVGNMRTAQVVCEYDLFTCLHKFVHNDDDFNEYSILTQNGCHVAPSIGIDGDTELYRYNDFDYLCIDVANGYTESFVDYVKRMREKFSKVTIIAGNVCTPEMAEELVLSGADIVKCGIGPGAACTTRMKTGVGFPQLSTIIECADAVHGLGGHMIADGGCRVPGDIGKAFGAGADFVMLGGMLASHDENSDFDEDGNALFYGMSSTEAMKKHYGKVDKHRTSEGRVVKLKSKGSLHNTIQDILGGLRSTCTYVGAKSLKELSKRTTFIRVNNQLNTTYSKNTIGG